MTDAEARTQFEALMALLVPLLAQHFEPDFAAWAAGKFEPARYTLNRRTAQRNALVLQELARTPGKGYTERAAALARRLNHAAAGMRDASGQADETAALINSLSLERKPIGWQHIAEIERDARELWKDRCSDPQNSAARSAA